MMVKMSKPSHVCTVPGRLATRGFQFLPGLMPPADIPKTHQIYAAPGPLGPNIFSLRCQMPLLRRQDMRESIMVQCGGG
jgi:hypothetical protein